MNSNSLIASLKNGYGRSASIEMLEALGLDRDEPCSRPAPLPRPITVNAGWRLARNPGRPANANLRLVG